MDDEPSVVTPVPVGANACGCAPHEVCSEGRCHPRKLVASWLLQGGDAVAPHLNTGTFAESGNADITSITSEVGCSLGFGETTFSRYQWSAFDVGDVTLKVQGGDSFAFPEVDDGDYASDYAYEILDASNDGGDVIHLTVGGGIDVPATVVTATMPPRIVLDPVEPLVPGEDWTVSWTPAAPVVSLSLSTEGAPVITCVVEDDTTVTFPWRLTERLELASKVGFELSFDTWGDRASTVVDGTTVAVRGMRIQFSQPVPVAP